MSPRTLLDFIADGAYGFDRIGSVVVARWSPWWAGAESAPGPCAAGGPAHADGTSSGGDGQGM